MANSKKPIITTIALKAVGLIEEVKRRDDVKIFKITENNRDSLVSEILNEAKGIIET